MGESYLDGNGVYQSDAKAFKYFSLAAAQGEASAQNHLGRLYQEGRGVKQSYNKAFFYYKLAADQGLSAAQVISQLYKFNSFPCL